MHPATHGSPYDDDAKRLSRPVEAASPKLACVLMASGMGERFGANKLLVPFGDRPLICRALAATDSPLFSRRVVVTRHPGIAEICEGLGIPSVLHSLPGRNDTVRLGLRALAGDLPDGCMFCACDQPLLSRRSVERMLLAFLEDPDHIYRLSYGGVAANPILFPRSCFPALQNLPRDKGGACVARAHPEMVRHIDADSPWELKDVDTKKDLAELLSLPGANK